jgi:putative transposase
VSDLVDRGLDDLAGVLDQVQQGQPRADLQQRTRDELAGPRTPGKASGEIRYHGSQSGRVQLADRQLRVNRPRLRHKKEGEVKVPAYERMRRGRGLGQHLLGALLRGISTREYQDVLPQMAETVGVSRSAISRQAIEASIEQLQQLQERRWEDTEILVIYIDGQRFAEYHIVSAVGVDRDGKKHILGIEPGATENAAAVKRLLVRLRDHGLPTDRKYLFVIDGAKALRAAIDEVFGAGQPVQRCRNHKIRNVLNELPKEQHGQTRNLLRAAWKVKTAEEGEKRLKQLARFLEHGHESAARSLREGMAEMFTSRIVAQMFGDDQSHREPAERGRAPHRKRYAMAGCRDGRTLGGFGLAAHRKALPAHRRPRRPLGVGCHPRPRNEVRN